MMKYTLQLLCLFLWQSHAYAHDNRIEYVFSDQVKMEMISYMSKVLDYNPRWLCCMDGMLNKKGSLFILGFLTSFSRITQDAQEPYDEEGTKEDTNRQA